MWGRGNQNQLVRQPLNPNMNLDQNPPDDAVDNFDEEGANPNMQQGGAIHESRMPNPRIQLPSPVNERNNIPNDHPIRSMRDYLQPTCSTTPSCILLPV